MADHSTINTHGAFFDRIADFPGAMARGFATLGRGVATSVVTGTKKMQYSRMVSVLRASSDTQLAHIGITRADIPRHAAHLVNYEYDGL